MNKSHKLLFVSLVLLVIVSVVSLNTKFPTVGNRALFSPENTEVQKSMASEYYQQSMDRFNWGIGLTFVGLIVIIGMSIFFLKKLDTSKNFI